MQASTPQSRFTALDIAQPDDISIARTIAKELASAFGFVENECEEIAIVVSELASNLINHAGQGKLTLSRLDGAGRTGIQIESCDAGPGIPDAERALIDGFSTAGTLGTGLGTVHRLTDCLDITSQPGSSTRIVCQRWHRTAVSPTPPCPLDLGVASRSHPAMQVNGDAFVIKSWGQAALLGVIDGLGHGQFAHQAAETARQFVETHCDQPLEAIFRGVVRVSRTTRGVVMALARFDYGHEQRTHPLPPEAPVCLTFAAVGNIEVRVYGNVEPFNFVLRRGVLGGNAPAAAVTKHRWAPSTIMVLHSDGLHSHWRFDDFPSLAHMTAADGARQLLRSLQKDDDDATVIVVKGAGAGMRDGQ